MRRWLLWTLGFLAYPVAGIAGELVGRVDDVPTALIGGLVTGAVIGAGQVLAGSGRLVARRWIPASAAGMAVGLGIGSAVVHFGTSAADLAVMGALTGLALGAAQAWALTVLTVRGRLVWAAAVPVLWALGWTVTTAVGVDVETQYTVFGSTGAVTVQALSGLLLHALAPVQVEPIGEPA